MGNLPFIYFFPAFFIGMWILTSYMISKKGWSNFVAHYQLSDTFPGEKIGIISATINGTNYSNAFVMKYNEEGIYLKPVILFRLFHQPVLIPWKEIKEVRDKKILFSTFKELVIGQPFVATIMIKKSLFSKLENKLYQYSSIR